MGKRNVVSVGLLSLALLANAFYKNGYRVLISFIAIFVTAGHFIFFNDTTSFAYYGSVSIACLITILSVSLFASSPLGTDIQLISLAGIFINMLGYYQHQSGVDPALYNELMTVLITAEFIRLMLRTNRDRIHDVFEADSRDGDILIHANSSSNVNSGGCK